MPDVVLPVELDVLVEGWPTLVWCPVRVTHPSGTVEHYQLVLALHRHAAPEAEPSSFIGIVSAPSGTVHVYEAMGDPLGALLLGRLVAPDLRLDAMEGMRSEGSTSAVAFDERWELVLYRRLVEGPNPDVEIPTALGRAGADVVVPPVATWTRHEWDLASVRPLLPKAIDGDEVVRRSLAETLGKRCPPDQAKADIGPDAELLGNALGHLHVALAEAFGVAPASGSELAERLVTHARRTAPRGVDLRPVEDAYRRLESATDLGAVIRIHGDLQLGNLLRDRRSWAFVDFGGDVRLPLAERRAPTSPLHDVAALARAFRRAAQLAAAERLAVAGADEDPELALLATAWEERAGRSLVAGYASVDAVHPLLPADRASRDALLTLFELNRAWV